MPSVRNSADSNCAVKSVSLARGFKSPYLRTFVVARINPVRFHRTKPGDKKPPMPIAAALTRMTAAAKNFDVGKVRTTDLALVAALSSE